MRSVYIAAAVVFGLLLLAAITWEVVRVVRAYRGSTGTLGQKFMAGFSHSATILLARLGAISAAIFAWFIDMLPQLDPSTQVGAALAAVLKPEYVPFYALAFALAIETARRSKGSVDPITPPAIK